MVLKVVDVLKSLWTQLDRCHTVLKEAESEFQAFEKSGKGTQKGLVNAFSKDKLESLVRRLNREDVLTCAMVALQLHDQACTSRA
jgi:NAD-dependent DNA ligase